MNLYWKIWWWLRDRHMQKYAKQPPSIQYDKRYHTHVATVNPYEDGDIGYVLGEIVLGGLVYHFVVAGMSPSEPGHMHSFDAVLKIAYEEADTFQIPHDCLDEYSQQELEFLKAVVQRGKLDMANYKSGEQR